MDNTFLLVVIIFVIQGAAFGAATKALASIKGYDGYFPVGFLFSVIGLIYVVGLPESASKQNSKNESLAKLIAEEISKTHGKQ